MNVNKFCIESVTIIINTGILLFADDMVVLQEIEDNLQKSMYELRKVSNIFNCKISAVKNKSYGIDQK
jgi:hypothetical protein